MRKIPIILKVLVLIVIVSAHNVNAEVIFEDDFNNQPNWWPTSKQVDCVSGTCVDGIPTGWSFWRNDELWTPYGSTPTLGTNPTIQISSLNYFGAIGKGFTVYNESHSGSSGDGWGADGILAKRLSQDQKEIYVQFRIKFQQGFQRFWTVGGNASMIKIFRAFHYDGTGSPFLFFTNGNVAPAYIFDTVANEYGNQFATAMRCDPQATQYACTGNTVPYTKYVGSLPWSSSLGDGNWHTLKWHLKMNTALDAKDGVVEFWMDGLRQLSKINMDWLRAGGDVNAGWNVVAIGGNSFNQFSNASNKAEQWYAIDDFVVSTTPIPADYVIGGPKAPKNLLGVPVKP